MFRLLRQQKKAVIYNVGEKQFWELRNYTQWEDFISRCSIELRRKIKERAALEDPEYESPALFPFEKSINRYAGK